MVSATSAAPVHPIGYGCPVRLWYGLDEIAQSGVLSDGDGEADIHLATDGNDGVGIEAAVGPHRERSRGTGVAHSRHRLPAGSWLRPRAVLARPLAQSCHQHVSGFLRQRPAAGDSPAGRCSCDGRAPSLCQSVGLADRRVYVDRPEGESSGACPGVPGARQQTPGSPGPSCPHMSPTGKLRRKVPQRGMEALTTQPSTEEVPARTQHVGVVYAVAASQSGCHQGSSILSPVLARPGASPRSTWVVDELAQTQTPGQGDRQDQPGIGYQAGIVEGDLDAVRVVTW